VLSRPVRSAFEAFSWLDTPYQAVLARLST
jgi:hypothetical protein